MRSVVLACEHACAGARPDRRRVTRHPSRTSAVTTENPRDEGRRKVYDNRKVEKREKDRERRERRCRPWGRRHKRIASHATELNPPLKFTLLRRSLSRVQGCPNLTNVAPRDERRDVPASESISESGLDSDQRFAYDN